MPAQAFPEPLDLGRRIVIYGATGSGKTTLSQQLGALLGVDVIELDAIRHAGGWDSTDWPEMRAEIEHRIAAARDGWVAEGNYSAVRDVTLLRAESVIWLRLPWRLSFWRLLQRTMSRSLRRHALYGPDGPRESLRLALASRHSILLWSITNHRRHGRNTQRALEEMPHEARVLVLRSARDVEALVRAVERTRVPSSS